MRELRGLLSGADHLTWETLATRVAKAAGGLARLGIGEGDTVAILMRNDAPFLEASPRRPPPRRLRGADQLAFQGGGGRLYPPGQRRARARRP